jgi:hypothetical protein
MGGRARLYVEEHFSRRVGTAAYVALFRELAGQAIPAAVG